MLNWTQSNPSSSPPLPLPLRLPTPFTHGNANARLKLTVCRYAIYIDTGARESKDICRHNNTWKRGGDGSDDSSAARPKSWIRPTTWLYQVEIREERRRRNVNVNINTERY